MNTDQQCLVNKLATGQPQSPQTPTGSQEQTSCVSIPKVNLKKAKAKMDTAIGKSSSRLKGKSPSIRLRPTAVPRRTLKSPEVKLQKLTFGNKTPESKVPSLNWVINL